MIDPATVVEATTKFLQDHPNLMPIVMFGLAFGESLAIVSFLVPATVLMLAIGALVEASGLSLWPVWLAAVVGASLGDAVSYWLGYHYKDRARTFWPLSRRSRASGWMAPSARAAMRAGFWRQGRHG